MSEESNKPLQLSSDEMYLGTSTEMLNKFSVNPGIGLSEAGVAERLVSYGANKLADEKRESLFSKLLNQFKDYMVLILIAAAVVSGALGDWIEAVVIIAIVVVNAILGVYQEGQAEKAIEALQKMSSPQARVLREGKQKLVDSQALVPGDIVMLEAGDVVPADLRLIESSNLKAEEASLTGESVPVEKDASFMASGPLRSWP